MRFLTTKEAAEYLAVSLSTLKRWRKENRSPPYLKQGGIIRYALDDLKKWAEAHSGS